MAKLTRKEKVAVSEANDTLTALVDRLEQAINGDAERQDAISAELARPGRKTATVSLQDAPEIERFREELTDGLIRVDTANRLLNLVNTVVSHILAGR